MHLPPLNGERLLSRIVFEASFAIIVSLEKVIIPGRMISDMDYNVDDIVMVTKISDFVTKIRTLLQNLVINIDVAF